MPTTRGQWTIYSKSELGDTCWVYTDEGPPSEWTLGWEDVFQTTEFSLADQCQIGVLVGDFNGHLAKSVVVENWTTGELAIWRGLRNVVEIKEKEEERNDND